MFRVESVRRDDDRILYLGEPLVGADELERRVYPAFREAGYDVRLATVQDTETDPISGVELRSRRRALVAQPADGRIDSVPWTNVVMLAATVLTTLFAGSVWYYEPLTGPLDLFTGDKWKFSVAVLSVLAVHELGHYVLSRYHRVNASLPYFIPIPSFIGTLGAVIRMKGRIPDRKALFDIGVAGPLAGLVAAVVVSAVGLLLPPIAVPESVLGSANAVEIRFGYPPLLQFLSTVLDRPLSYADPSRAVNPVVFGGWVGMFVTVLNLLPVGQLDGGHLVRAMAGDRAETVAALVPAALFGLAGYLYLFTDVGFNAPFLWGFWGVFSLGLAYMGSADPVFDEPLDAKRMAVGVLTFALGALCFVPVPFELMSSGCSRGREAGRRPAAPPIP
ncbi:site-2 protease family protein [Halosegnis marinus]|uniref:site-2 protease family protein n=1 Tax=Halosegnis marinus TaxID=3034023 RepID=UPI00361735BC